VAKGGASIIVIKRVKKHGHAHHGGSWKVAYADFVTAMMAFFMVMWIVGLDDQTRRSVEEYFSRAVGIAQGDGGGASPLSVGRTPQAAMDTRIAVAVRSAEQANFRAAAERLRERLDAVEGALASASVEVTVGDDGLRIELIESGSGDQFFPRGSATPRPGAADVLTVITDELRRLHNPVVIEGHTDAAPYGTAGTYSNWELSADRANAARRMVEAAGLNPMRIVEVRGLAATRPRNADNAFASENRRISLLLPFAQPLVRQAGTGGAAAPVGGRAAAN
jgi:chemotaxis protein MotB